VERILGHTPDSRQTMLFSATMPGAVVALARRYMTQPTHIRAIDPTDDGATVAAVEQFVYRAHAMDKVELLARVLQAEGRALTMIFCRTKRTCAKVADELAIRGFASAAIHGDLGQGAREQAMRAFRNGKVDVLVATDVAARGIDVEGITHVINYQCPEDEKTYLHRIGRTARAGNAGVAITLVDWDDLPRWGLINKALDLGIPEPQETYSNSEHLYIDLGIPTGTGATLPGAQQVRAGLAAEEVEDLGETGRRGGPGGASSGSGGGPGGSRGGRGGSDGGRKREGDGGGRGGRGARGGSGRGDSGGNRGRSDGEHVETPAGGERKEGAGRPRNRRRRTRGGAGGAAAQTSAPEATP
jgi:superfamily II DNA/RNA helicase